jgi:hypothetical protein
MPPKTLSGAAGARFFSDLAKPAEAEIAHQRPANEAQATFTLIVSLIFSM